MTSARVISNPFDISFQLPQPFILVNNACVMGSFGSLSSVLCIGSIEGELLIYQRDQLIFRQTGLGHITCMLLNKIWSCDTENILLLTNAEGYCFIFQHANQEPIRDFIVPYNVSTICLYPNIVVFGTRDRRIHLFQADISPSGKRTLQQLDQHDLSQEIESVIIRNASTLQIGLPDGQVCSVRTNWQKILQVSNPEKIALIECVIYLLNDIQSTEYQNISIIASTDGIVRLYAEDELVWKINIHSTILHVGKILIRGIDHLLIATWNREVRILDIHDGTQVGFSVPRHVSACAIDRNTFAVISTNGSVYVYENNDISIRMPDLLDLVRARIKKHAVSMAQIEHFNQVNAKSVGQYKDASALAQFIHISSCHSKEVQF